jgi:hypothetical protein
MCLPCLDYVFLLGFISSILLAWEKGFDVVADCCVLHDQAELRASVFEAIEDEDRVAEENEDGGNPALLGSCNDRAKQLHASPSGLSELYLLLRSCLVYSAL